MAARIRRITHDENTRAKIKTSQLINRLQKHIDGEVELNQSQVRSIEILLKKSLPDLSAIHTTENTEKSFEDWLDDLDTDSSENSETEG
jgi:hypothetical protein